MRNRLKRAARYVKAAPWPYMTGTASLLLALGLGAAGLAYWAKDIVPTAAACGWWALCWVVVAIFAMADGASRHREYKRIKAIFIRYGYSERILTQVARSRCQRDAALHAARETGHFDQAKAFFLSLGYRWYHILPDTVVRNPFVFASPTFIRTSFLPGKKARA